MARIRETFGSHANTAHAWAQQTHGYGRSGDRRMYFEGATIFSYGAHFALAKFLPESFDGRRVVLVNSEGYSSSTSKHKGHVWHALHGLNVIQIPIADLTSFDRSAPTPDKLRPVFESLVEELAREMRPYPPEHVWREESYESDIEDARTNLAAFKAAFKVRLKVPADPVAWSDKRAADAKHAAIVAKVKEARRIVAFNFAQLDEYAARPIPEGNAYTLENELRSLDRFATQFRSARLTLGKAKLPKLVKQASAIVKTIKTRRDAVQTAYETQTREERHAFLDRDLAKVREWLASGAPNDGHALANDRESYCVELWMRALEIGDAACAEAIGHHVSEERLEKEIEDNARQLENLAMAGLTLDEIDARYAHPAPKYGRKKTTPEEWRAGLGDSFYYGAADTTLLRRKGDRLETSRGAVAPWRAAVRAFQFAQACRREGKEWRRNGEQFQIGSYHLDRVGADGSIVAGCHSLPWAEIELCAVANIPPADLAPTFPLPAIVKGV